MNRVSAHTRQNNRRQQRGQLNRSVLTVLLCAAVVMVAVWQAPLLQLWGASAQEKLVVWTGEQGFTIKRLDVVGRNQISGQEIMQALQVKQGAPIFAYDPQGAVARLSANPWIKSVNVERRMPDTIFVRITERIPAARWQVQGKLAVVDIEGAVLTTTGMDMYKDLPVIIGQEARHKVVALFDLLRGEPDLAKDVTAATWISNRRWNLTLRNNVIVKLPAEDPGLALSAFVEMNKRDRLLDRDVTVVDLRLPKQVIVQPTVRANALIERPDFSDNRDKHKQAI